MNAADYIAFDVETATAETSIIYPKRYLNFPKSKIIF